MAGVMPVDLSANSPARGWVRLGQVAYRVRAMGEAVIHRPGEGERHGAGGTSAIIIKASGDDTAGTSFSRRRLLTRPPRAPLHSHERSARHVLRLDGMLTMRLADETHQLGPGTFVCVPPGVATPPAMRATLRFGSSTSTRRRVGRAICGSSARRQRRPLTPDVIGRIASHTTFRPSER